MRIECEEAVLLLEPPIEDDSGCSVVLLQIYFAVALLIVDECNVAVVR
jgi:hypothetical protein